MLKHGDINPLNVAGLREIAHCPPHFVKVPFDLATTDKRIRDWVYENLEGRFWYGDSFHNTDGGNIVMQKCVAFEVHSEASYFSLFLDKFNSWDAQNLV